MAADGWLTSQKIAHRGLHDAAKGVIENSLAAARAACAKNFAIEADLRLSRDGEIFVFHDDDLDRLTFARGRFADFDAAALKNFRLRGGQIIPTLAELLEAVAGATPLILELKSDFVGDPALAKRSAEALASYAGPVALKSFDPAPMGFLRQNFARWPLGLVVQSDFSDFTDLPREAREKLARFDAAAEILPDFLSWRARDLPCAASVLARAFGAPILAWTIRDVSEAARLAAHADQIIFEGFDPDA